MLTIFKQWSEHGMRLPYGYDPVTEQPSITILFPYVTFVLAVISVIVLHFVPSIFTATITAIIFWAIAVVFYLLRKLEKAKFDFSERSIELVGDQTKRD